MAFRPLGLVRALTVVSGGPAALEVASLLAPVSAARRWPERARTRPVRAAALTVTTAGVVAPWVYFLAVRPWLQRWGSTPAERRRSYPGDRHDAAPLFTVTRAVTVHAPAEHVWRWLVQIGQDRGGFYSYDWLENLAGCRLRSADAVHEEWQDLAPGDPLRLAPEFATRISAVDSPRSLVIENWGAYVVQPVDSRTCRLIARSQQPRSPATAAYLLAIELPHAIMERKMLLGIKARAEASAGPAHAAPEGPARPADTAEARPTLVP